MIRSYDSRDQRFGDFGVGWRLAFQDVRVERLRGTAVGWDLQTHGDLAAWGVTNTCIVESWAHVISVIFPDGRTYKFRPELSEGEGEPPCAWWAPIEDAAWMSYVPMGATRGSLRPLTPNPNDGNTDPHAVVLDRSAWGSADPENPPVYWYVATEEFDDSTPYEPTEWVLTTEDGTAWEIDEQDGLTAVEDRNGNRLEFGPFGIESSSGQTVTISRLGDDPGGPILRITDPAGNWLRYWYDGSYEHLTNVHDRTAHATQVHATPRTDFLYEDTAHPLLLTEIRQAGPSGQTPPPYTRTYFDEDDGRMTAICRVVGSNEDCLDLETGRDLDAHVVLIPDLNGNPPVEIECDPRGNVVRRTDMDGDWLTTYAADDQAETEVTPRETGSGYATTTYAYTDDGNVETITNDLGTVASYAWGPGNLLTSMTEPGLPPTTFTYDPQGNLATTTDGFGRVSVTHADDHGNVDYTRDAMGHETFATWEGGQLARSIDASELTTTYTRDANGNVRVMSRESEDGEQVTLTDVDADDRPIRTTSPEGGVTETQYDAFGRVSMQRTLVDEEEDEWRSATTVHDAYGRAYRTVYSDGTFDERGFDENGNVVWERGRTKYAG